MKIRWEKLFLALGCLIINSALAVMPAFVVPTPWKNVAAGLEYTAISNFSDFPGGSLHVFRIDPQHYNFRIGVTKDPAGEDNKTLQQLMREQNAIIAINGGFFAPDDKPLGLLISQGKLLNSLRPTSWWGVFSILGTQPKITARKDYQPDPAIDFAIQAGPRLLVNGQIPNTTSNIDYRTALGITKDGRIIIAVTENLMLTTQELAEIMRRSDKEGGLGCINALNLDGGHSTQMYTRLSNLLLQVPSFTQVADAVLVVPK